MYMATWRGKAIARVLLRTFDSRPAVAALLIDRILEKYDAEVFLCAR
jgi:hypothetical protein